jgi:hypothetical protein
VHSWETKSESIVDVYIRVLTLNAPNSDVDNGGAEPKDVGVGNFRHPRHLVRATDVHIGISRSFFNSVLYLLFQENKSFGVRTICIHPLM